MNENDKMSSEITGFGDASVYLTVTEACAYLRISKTTLYDLMSDGRLPFYRIKGTRKRRLKRSDLDALIELGNPSDDTESDD
jgi:excisionase family DNA binding protein